MASRDNFTAKAKRILGDRVGYRCSCPTCRRLTIGPTKDISAPLLIAEAAHISAASEGGPRFNQNLTPAERKAVENGIWLCAACHTMVDKDHNHFTDELLRTWKQSAEDLARREVEGEVIFSGYREPGKVAEQHFKSQFQEYAPARADLGREKESPEGGIPLVWVQIVAISSLKELVKLTPADMKRHTHDIRPVVCTSWGTEVSRFGVHVAGYSSSASGAGSCLKSLVQIFRDGSIASGFVMFDHTGPEFGFDYIKTKLIPWIAFENRLMTSIGQGVKILRSLQVPQAAFLRLVVSGMMGYGVASDPGRWIQHERSDTDTIQTSPSMVRNFDIPPTEIARPLLEEFWQHLGVWHSPSYDESGEFIRRK